MSDYKLVLKKREITGKKLKGLRMAGEIPSVIYGKENEPILASSAYLETEKALKNVGYHSSLELELGGKKYLAIVKNINFDPIKRTISNIEFQSISKDTIVEAIAPIKLVGFEESPANKLHYVLLQVMEEIAVKAKPADLPSELVIDASGLANLDDKITLADLKLPKNVEIASKELEMDQVIANIYDPVAESEAREAESNQPEIAAADVPSDSGKKEEETKE